MQLCTKEIFLFTPKEMQDIYLLQSIIVGVKHNFLLIQIVANYLNNITWIYLFGTKCTFLWKFRQINFHYFSLFNFHFPYFLGSHLRHLTTELCGTFGKDGTCNLYLLNCKTISTKLSSVFRKYSCNPGTDNNTQDSNYTPRLWRDVRNSFDIVSVCLSVCLSVSLSWPNEQTYRLEFWHGGQVDEFLGQVCRSRS